MSSARPKRRRGSRLLLRIALALAAVGLLPLGFSSLQLVLANRDAMTQQVLRSHSLAASSTADRIAAFLATRQALARAAAGNPALADPAAAEAHVFLGESLQAWAELGIEVIALVDEGGIEQVRVQIQSATARRNAERAVGLSPSTKARIVLVDGAPLLILDAPSGSGAVRLLCEGAGLADLLRPQDLGQDAELLVVDAERRVVIGALRSLAELPRSLLDTALSGQTRGAKEVPADGGPHLLSAWAPVDGTDWTVLSLQPIAVAEAVARRMRGQALVAVAGAMLLIAVLATLAWASIVRPLHRLLVAQRALAGAAAPAPGGSEIAELEAGFASLERHLKDRNDLTRVFLGRYQIIEELGRGGMGIVFRGFDPKLERPVALKTVRLDVAPGTHGEEGPVSGLRREALTVARLNHRNVVAVYDLEQTRAGAFVAMELVEGESLAQLLQTARRLDAPAVACLALAVARGLAAAHAQGIVHRDIKPANILLGREGAIKVTDFGIAAFVSSAAGEPPDRIFGTPGYVPPEAFRAEPYTAAGDLFALGVVLYVATTGVEPFQGRTLAEIAQRTLGTAVTPPSRLVMGVPAELESLLLRLLDRDPTRRPTAGRLVSELEELVRRWGARWSAPRAESAAAPGAPVAAAHTIWLPTQAAKDGRAAS